MTAGELSAFLGNRDTRNGSLVANVPFGAHSAARVTFVGQQQDGHLKNLTSGKRLASNDHYQGRARLRYQPDPCPDRRRG
ncbi:MAG: hypothetical protein ACNA7W_03980 [Pseudomonadales bacterium]